MNETYRVHVTREGSNLLASVEDLPGGHTYASSFDALDAAVREVICLVRNLPEGAESNIQLDWDLATAVR